MSYLDRIKMVLEEYDPEHTYTFKGPCLFCKKDYTIIIKGPELFDYRKSGRIDSLRSNSMDDREFLISGSCPKCWDEMFPEEEDGDNSGDME